MSATPCQTHSPSLAHSPSSWPIAAFSSVRTVNSTSFPLSSFSPALASTAADEIATFHFAFFVDGALTAGIIGSSLEIVGC